eukprot:gene12158-13412_t
MDSGKEELSGLDSVAYGAFWDEFQSIHSETDHVPELETQMRREEDVFDDFDDIEWLNDIGLAGVVGKYKDRKRIDTNDAEFQTIASTLTRRQSATVRKRIESLNDTWKKMRKEPTSRHADVRSIFPAKTDGQSSKASDKVTTGSQSSKIDDQFSGLAVALTGLAQPKSCFFNTKVDKQATSASTEVIHKAKPVVYTEQRSSYAVSKEKSRIQLPGMSLGQGREQSELAGRNGHIHTSVVHSQSDGNATSTSKNHHYNHNYLPAEVKRELSEYRHAIDKNMNIFYSADAEEKQRLSKSPQPIRSAKLRPPPPRRTKSEDLLKVDLSSSSLPTTNERLRKSPSAGNPIPVHELMNKNVKSRPAAVQPTRIQANKSPIGRSLNNLDMVQLDLPRSGLIRHAGIKKHKSEENLILRTKNLKASSSSTAGLTDNQRTDNQRTDNQRTDNVQTKDSFDGDAKLDIGSDTTTTTTSSGKENASLFNDRTFPPLPNFSLKQEKTGMTRISDLSEQDMAKVRSLALIELTALFDNCEGVIFGVALPFLSQRDYAKESDKGKSQVPRFFKDLIGYLQDNALREQGLLRVSGSQQRIKALRDELEESYSNGSDFNWKDRHARDVATILKQFLRELPIPLLTHEYQQTFVAVSGLQERKLQLQALNLLVVLMHPVYRNTLHVLLRFLDKVVQFDKENKMDLNNVSMIMAPNLFLESNNRTTLAEVHKVAETTDVMRMLIKYHKILWIVPDFMVTQIRYLHEAGSKARDTKAVKKIIAKRMKNETVSQPKGKISSSGDEIDSGEVEDLDPIIRVKAPMFNKTCMAIQVTDSLTASDVIERFRSKRNSIREMTELSRLIGTNANRKRSDSDLDRQDNDAVTLYEVGGNIGERRLDPNTNIMSLLKVNPNAEWLLKFKALL